MLCAPLTHEWASQPKALVLLAFQLTQCALAAELQGNIPVIMQFMEVERGFYKQEYMLPDKGDNIRDKQPLSGTSAEMFLTALNNAWRTVLQVYCKHSSSACVSCDPWV